MSEFEKPPTSVNKRRGVLDKENETYSNINDIEEEQPYYWYQGVGSLTGGSVNANVTHRGIQVTYNGESVIHFP